MPITSELGSLRQEDGEFKVVIWDIWWVLGLPSLYKETCLQKTNKSIIIIIIINFKWGLKWIIVLALRSYCNLCTSKTLKRYWKNATGGRIIFCEKGPWSGHRRCGEGWARAWIWVDISAPLVDRVWGSWKGLRGL
jgi:hypothetical protein